MTTRSQRLAAITCGVAAVLVGTGCRQRESSGGPSEAAATTQQRLNDVDSNDHIPAAQKEAIKAQITANTSGAKTTPASSH